MAESIDTFELVLRVATQGADTAEKALVATDKAGQRTALTLMKTEGATRKLADASTRAAGGLNDVGREMIKGAAKALGLEAEVSKVALGLSEMAAGGVVAVAFVAGAAIISRAYDSITAGAREAKKASDELIASLDKQIDAAKKASVAGQQVTLAEAQRRLDEAREAQRKAQLFGGTETADIAGGASFGGGEADRLAKIAQATDRVRQAEINLAEVRKRLGDSAQQSDAAQISALTTLIKLGEATKPQREQAILLVKGLSDALRALPVNDTIGRAGLAGQIRELNDALFPKLHEHVKKLEGELTPLAKSPLVSLPYSEIASGDLPDIESPMKTIPEKAIKQLPPLINESGRVAVDAMNKLQSDMEASIGSLSQVLGDGVYEAFAAAFNGEGIGGVFKAFGKTVLAGIGEIFGMMGRAYLEYGLVMSGIMPSLANPVTAGPAAIAIGVALTAMSAALGAIAHGRGSSASSARSAIRGPQEVVQVLKFVNRPGMNETLTPLAPVVIHAYGPNDPKTQRWMLETFAKAQRR